MDRPHPDHSDNPLTAECYDQLIARKRLPPNPVEEFGFVKGTELDDDRLGQRPFRWR
ncbi:hypothetical protein OKW41_001917 [Paraburkholderia sp. UCT70]